MPNLEGRSEAPLGAPPILTPPAGWLGFLGLKSGGRQPQFTSRDLVPTMEAFNFYMAGGRTALSGSTPVVQAAAQNLSSSNAINVPAGKMWLIDRVTSLSDALGVAANIYGAIMIVDPSSQVYTYGPLSPKGITGERIPVSLNGPLLLPGGFSIRVYTAAAAAPTAFNWNTAVFGMEVVA